MPPLRIENPFAASPFKRNAKEVAEIFFAHAKVKKIGDFAVVYEEGVADILIRKMEVFADDNGNGIRDPGEQVYHQYNLMVFISKDSSYLKEAFEKTAPNPEDVCIFLEDNSTDTFSSTTAFVRQSNADIIVGDHVKDSLQTWLQSEGGSGVGELQVLGDKFGFEVGLNQQDLQQLVDEGELVNTNQRAAMGLFQLLNGFAILTGPLYGTVGEWMNEATAWTRGKITFSEESWNPDAAGEGGEFIPALIPFAPDVLDALEGMKDDAADRVNSALSSQLKAYRTGLTVGTSRLVGFRGVDFVVPDQLKRFVERCIKTVEAMLDQMIRGYKSLSSFFMAFGEQWIYMLNAFYCGLWNSLVEAVLGIVDLIGYVFRGMAMVGEATSQAQEIIPQALEIVDELYQLFTQTDVTRVFKQVFAFLVEQIHSLSIPDLSSFLSPEKIGYFVGALAGFAVEIIVGFFWSGGLDGVRATLTKLGKLGTDFFEWIVSAMRRIVGMGAGFSLEGLVVMVRYLVSLFRKGAEEIEAVLAEVFDAVRRGYRTVEEFLDEIMRRLGITSRSQIDEAGDLGMEFSSLYDDFCTLCRKA